MAGQVFLRERTDKDTPNAVNTYRKVWQSIQDNVTVSAECWCVTNDQFRGCVGLVAGGGGG